MNMKEQLETSNKACARGCARKFLAIAAGLAFIGGSCASPEPGLNRLSRAEANDGWKLLFDGQTTAGWRGCAQTNFPKQGWVIEDGCLKNDGSGQHKPAGGGDLVTTEKFTDFDFKFEWRISPAGNSGVKYLVHEGRSGKSGIGCEYQLLDDTSNEDARNGANRQAGALYALIAPNAAKHLMPVGEFNQSEIIVRGNHVEHWLNGARIVEFELGSPELKEAIAKSKFRNVQGFAEKMPTVLLLQDHGDAVWFRNLRIRNL
jgi:hypothetical protein